MILYKELYTFNQRNINTTNDNFIRLRVVFFKSMYFVHIYITKTLQKQ